MTVVPSAAAVAVGAPETNVHNGVDAVAGRIGAENSTFLGGGEGEGR